MTARTGGGHRMLPLVVGVLLVLVAVAGWMIWSGRAPVGPDVPSLDIDVTPPAPPTLPRPSPMPDPQPAPLPVPGQKGG